jgi:hypothetical protein
MIIKMMRITTKNPPLEEFSSSGSFSRPVQSFSPVDPYPRGREAALSMSVRVAVSDPLPMFRQGVMACLEDMAVETDYPIDLRAWAHDVDRRVVLLTIQAAADWELLSDLCRLPGMVIIAMLAEADVAGYLRLDDQPPSGVPSGCGGQHAVADRRGAGTRHPRRGTLAGGGTPVDAGDWLAP